MSWRAWVPLAEMFVGRAPLGIVPPATVDTSCSAVVLRLGKLLSARGKETGVATAAVAERTRYEYRIAGEEYCCVWEMAIVGM